MRLVVRSCLGQVVEVEADGAVQGLLGGAEWGTGGQDIVLVAFAAVSKQGKAPRLGMAGVAQPTQLQLVAIAENRIDVGELGPVTDF